MRPLKGTMPYKDWQMGEAGKACSREETCFPLTLLSSSSELFSLVFVTVCHVSWPYLGPFSCPPWPKWVSWCNRDTSKMLWSLEETESNSEGRTCRGASTWTGSRDRWHLDSRDGGKSELRQRGKQRGGGGALWGYTCLNFSVHICSVKMITPLTSQVAVCIK